MWPALETDPNRLHDQNDEHRYNERMDNAFGIIIVFGEIFFVKVPRQYQCACYLYRLYRACHHQHIHPYLRIIYIEFGCIKMKVIEEPIFAGGNQAFASNNKDHNRRYGFFVANRPQIDDE
jgi:hypothetical protein